jgi:hypothetical protein
MPTPQQLSSDDQGYFSAKSEEQQQGYFSARENMSPKPSSLIPKYNDLRQKVRKRKNDMVKAKTKAKTKTKTNRVNKNESVKTNVVSSKPLPLKPYVDKSKEIKDRNLKIWEMMQVKTHFPDFPLEFFLQLISDSNPKVSIPLYHGVSRERLEFLGDRVLKIIHGRMAFETTDSAKEATDLVHNLESNRVFSCYLEKLGKICTLLHYNYNSSVKNTKLCADFFEVLVGGLFYFYFYKNADYNIIQRIDTWIRDVTVFSEHVSQLLKDKNFSRHVDPVCSSS